MSLKRMQLIQIIPLGIVSAVVLYFFSMGRLLNFSEVFRWDIYAYTFDGYFEEQLVHFDVIHYSLLLFPFFSLTYLSTIYIETYIINLRYLSIYRFRKIQRWGMIHAGYLFVRCYLFLLIFHVTLITAGSIQYPGDWYQHWTTILLLCGKQGLIACVMSLLQMYVSIITSVHIGVVFSISCYSTLLLIDMSHNFSCRFITIADDGSGILYAALILSLLLGCIIANSQKKLLHIVFS